MKKVKIEEAPNCEMNKKGEVYVNGSKTPCKITQDGEITIENGEQKNTIKLNVEDLIKKYFPQKEKTNRGPRDKERYEKVKALFVQGKTRKEIKNELNLKSIGFYIKKIKSEQKSK